MKTTGPSKKCSTREQKAELIATMTCAICLEPPRTDPVTTKCGHVFCEACLYEWLANDEKPCPMCRTLLVFNKLNGIIRPTFIFCRAQGSSSSEDAMIIAGTCDSTHGDALLDDASSQRRPDSDWEISLEPGSWSVEARTDASVGDDGAVTADNFIGSRETCFENISADEKTT